MSADWNKQVSDAPLVAVAEHDGDDGDVSGRNQKTPDKALEGGHQGHHVVD